MWNIYMAADLSDEKVSSIIKRGKKSNANALRFLYEVYFGPESLSQTILPKIALFIVY